MVDAVLLEWEGVLVDTRAARRDALVCAMDAERVHLPEALHHPSWNLLGMRDAAAAALAELRLDDPTLVDLVAMRATRAYATRLGTGISLQQGAREFVERVQQETLLAIVTHAGRQETEALLRLAELEGAVTIVVCSDDFPGQWSISASYERSWELLNRRRSLQRDRMIVLSSDAHALRAARVAGMAPVAVGAPAHVAVEANGAVAGVDGLTVAQLAITAGLASSGSRP